MFKKGVNTYNNNTNSSIVSWMASSENKTKQNIIFENNTVHTTTTNNNNNNKKKKSTTAANLLPHQNEEHSKTRKSLCSRLVSAGEYIPTSHMLMPPAVAITVGISQ